jgi:adenosylhomocysteine nucleosidase
MNESRLVLVTFAVAEEAAAFDPGIRPNLRAQVLITGIGLENAERAVTLALRQIKPSLVLTCGFAGGLDPDLTTGQVIFTSPARSGFEPALVAAGAHPGRFHSIDRVATTALEKQELREATGADVVEMESGAIAAVCRVLGVPCAMARVVLDRQQDDLPIDFNAVLNDRSQIDFLRLTWQLIKAPSRIAGLLRLRRDSHLAANELGRVLNAALEAWHDT